MELDVNLALLVPWAVRDAHRWSYALAMLRVEAARRAGVVLGEHDARRLATWSENLGEGDLVVHYDPLTDDGFSYVRRRRIDHDLIRLPVDEDRWLGGRSRDVVGVRDDRTVTDDRERAARPEDLERLFIERLNAGDVEGLVALYEPDAVMALPGGGTAAGTTAIRAALGALVAQRPRVARGVQQPTLFAGDLALTSARFDGGVVTVEVCRRQPDGTWLLLIDQPNING